MNHVHVFCFVLNSESDFQCQQQFKTVQDSAQSVSVFTNRLSNSQ